MTPRVSVNLIWRVTSCLGLQEKEEPQAAYPMSKTWMPQIADTVQILADVKLHIINMLYLTMFWLSRSICASSDGVSCILNVLWEGHQILFPRCSRPCLRKSYYTIEGHSINSYQSTLLRWNAWPSLFQIETSGVVNQNPMNLTIISLQLHDMC